MGSLQSLLLEHYPEPPLHVNAKIDENLLVALMPDKPNRVRHIKGVTTYACEVGAALGIQDRLEAVALAHDIAYANDLRRTGFHPLDGAIFLAHCGADEDIIHAVLHHTGAREEAKHWPKAAAFYDIAPYEPTLLDDAITFCDTQTSPVGERVTIEERISEIEGRYGPGSAPSQVMRRMQPNFLKIFERMSRQLSLGVSLSRSLVLRIWRNQPLIVIPSEARNLVHA